MDLLLCLSQGHGGQSLEGFYAVCRALCIKKEKHYFLFDDCFQHFFYDRKPTEKVQATNLEDIENWLKKATPRKNLTEAMLKKMKQFDYETLKEEFEKRLREQKERHDGGNHFIGTGGTSPFGHSGHHPFGIRMGGSSMNQSAAHVASKRFFNSLREDLVLDIRQIQMALKKLQRMEAADTQKEFDIDASIDKTCRNAGEIEAAFKPIRKSATKLTLMIDVGGSMDPFAYLSSQMFSAASKAKLFKELDFVFFHNCPYETLYRNSNLTDPISTMEFLKSRFGKWLLMVIGDAKMSPTEILMQGGSLDYFHYNEQTGLQWLKAIKQHISNAVWLNPLPKEYWDFYDSVHIIRREFPMFPLSLEGLESAIRSLRANH